MRYLLYALVALPCAAGVLVAWLLFRVWSGATRRDRAVLDRLRPVIDALARGRDPSSADLEALAAMPQTRTRLYDVLAAANRIGLFPKPYQSAPAFAESDLVYWLSHPNELGQAPDQIELMARITKPLPDARTVECFVFRFRVHPPHWAATDGWLAGVAGPCVVGEPLSTRFSGTFSEFERFDARTPEEHAARCLK